MEMIIGFLKNWKSNGVSTRDDVKALDLAFEQAAARKEKKSSMPGAGTQAVSSKFNNFHQRSYDFSELEKQLFNK